MLCFQNGASKAQPPGAATDLGAGGQGVEMVHQLWGRACFWVTYQNSVVDFTGKTTERKMSSL